jgi:hypothetical protein
VCDHEIDLEGWHRSRRNSLQTVPGLSRIADVLSIAYECIISFKTGRINSLYDDQAGRPCLDNIHSQISSLFNENEFHRVQMLPPELRISLSIMQSRLTQIFGLS